MSEPMPTAEDVERVLRERAESEGRGLDTVDVYLINMSRLLGVETTDRYLGSS